MVCFASLWKDHIPTASVERLLVLACLRNMLSLGLGELVVCLLTSVFHGTCTHVCAILDQVTS